MPTTLSILQKLLESEYRTPKNNTENNHETVLFQCPNIGLVQDQLMAAIDTLSLLIEAGRDKKVRIASKELDTDDIAVTVLHLVYLVRNLEEGKK